MIEDKVWKRDSLEMFEESKREYEIEKRTRSYYDIPINCKIICDHCITYIY